MIGLEIEDLRALLLNGLGGRRFTQATPILPDVWLAYALEPQRAQELLITPEREGRTEAIAMALREAVDEHRKSDRTRRNGKRSRSSPMISAIPELIAAHLYLDELVLLILAKTRWWAHKIAAAGRGAQGSVRHPYEDLDEPTMLHLSDDEIEGIGTAIDELVGHMQADGSPTAQHEAVGYDFYWLVTMLGAIALRCTRGVDAPGEASGVELARAFRSLVGDTLTGNGAAARSSAAFRISLNRRLAHAVAKSALAIKADAARLLFTISCRTITFAVIDSGIDREHPAFKDWSDGKGTRHRIDRTYDFTKVRALLEPRTVRDLAKSLRNPDAPAPQGEQADIARRLTGAMELNGAEDPPKAAGKLAKQLRDRIEAGQEIDWSLLEPFLADGDPPRPPNSHGTHVAGILAADWREAPRANGGGDAGEGHSHNGSGELPRSIMQGICPDIRLIDVRVLEPGNPVREFEAIAALHFLAYLNRRSDSQVVHGANMSFETPHSVENYACGSTPICEVCNSVWASGIVLVAAAGNHGHQRYTLASGQELGGYHAISITDPGNAEGVITVGSTHRKAHQYGVSYFSSRGPTGDGRRKPDLVAPGENVSGPSLRGGETVQNGTSCAAPHVSGAAALLMARFDELRGRPDRVKDVLCRTATDLGRESYFQGHGMIDILRALQSI